MEFLLNLDRELFLAINGAHAPWLDPLMVFASGKFTWIPLYLFILYYTWRTRGLRNLLLFILGVALTVALADQISVHLFKNCVQRLRPCHQPGLMELVYLPTGHCGGQFGFVSSHAANAFAVFLFAHRFIQKRWLTVTLLLWATFVGYSRIYMGVHYPGDVLGGALLGLLLGWVSYRLLLWLNSLLPQEKASCGNSTPNSPA